MWLMDSVFNLLLFDYLFWQCQEWNLGNATLALKPSADRVPLSYKKRDLKQFALFKICLLSVNCSPILWADGFKKYGVIGG